MPVSVESTDRFEASALSELVIDQRLAQRLPLLVFEGEIGDAVDVRFDRARLQDNSAQLLRRLGVTVPPGDHRVSILTERAESSKTFLRVDVIPTPGQASRVTIKSPHETGDSSLVLALRAHQARLAISILSAGETSPDAPPPQRTLRLNEQTLPRLVGAVPLDFLAAEDSEIRLRIIVSAAPGGDAIQRLSLAPADRPGEAMTAFGVGVRSDPKNRFTDYACATDSRLPLARPSQLAEGKCAGAQAKLQLVSMGLRPGLVSMQSAGQAWVRKNDSVLTLDLVAWLKKNPILAALVGALDAAVLAWCKQVFFSAHVAPQSDKTQASPP